MSINDRREPPFAKANKKANRKKDQTVGYAGLIRKGMHPLFDKPIFDEEKIKKAPPREKIVEGKVRTYAIGLGCYVRKFTSPSQRSVPDRIIVTPRGVVGFLEMKRKGNVPTPGQEKEMAILREHGCNVTWSDSFEGGKAFVDMLMELDAFELSNDDDLSDLE